MFVIMLQVIRGIAARQRMLEEFDLRFVGIGKLKRTNLRFTCRSRNKPFDVRGLHTKKPAAPANRYQATAIRAKLYLRLH